ncbi:MAG: acyltransferase family protein [Rickettsiales bacterium]
MTPQQAHTATPATFHSKLALAKWRPAGFDYMRLLLSIAVLSWHTVLMTEGLDAQTEEIAHSPWRGFAIIILPMFFALSGFLVAGSLDRTKNISDFVCLRILRILPALCFVVVLSAAVMGPLVTSYSLKDYVADPLFARYFLTIIGDVQDMLPGVFEHNPFPRMVNGQLWTIPVELECYVILFISAVFGIYRRPKLFLGFVLAVQLAFALRAIMLPVIHQGVPARVLMVCFLVGTIMNVYRERIPFRLDLACLCAALAFGLIYIPGGAYFLAFPAAYITIYLGLHNPKKIWLVSSGDYSYGIYLFAFPIQQLVASTGPWAHVWYMNLIISLPLSILMAIVSWRLIEKPALSYHHHIPKVHSGLCALRSKVKHTFNA